MLVGNKITLRALEPTDREFLYALENDTSLWHVSHTQTPFSKYVLTQYLENSHRDIYEVKQLRFIISQKETDTAIGCIDLYDFNPLHKRVGVGIVIFEKSKRGKGFASDSIEVLCKYAFSRLDVHQLYAAVSPLNTESIALFQAAGFKHYGVKKSWNYWNGKFYDELLYQKIYAKD